MLTGRKDHLSSGEEMLRVGVQALEGVYPELVTDLLRHVARLLAESDTLLGRIIELVHDVLDLAGA